MNYNKNYSLYLKNKYISSCKTGLNKQMFSELFLM